MKPLSPVLELLANLVRIPSVNPVYDEGGSEAACAEFVESYLKSFGIATWRQAVWPDRHNILALLPGKDRTRRMLFEAHLDTVSVQGMSIPPFEPRIVNDRMYGRGTCDTKGGLAAMMHAMVSLKQRFLSPEHDILLAAVVDEEASYRGVATLCAGMEPREPENAFMTNSPELTLGKNEIDFVVENQSPGSGKIRSLQADLAVVAEPTELRLTIASKGVLRWKIETLGLAAHSSKPHLGHNAILTMADVIQRLGQDAQQLQLNGHPLLGSPTLSIGTISGGVQVNTVPDRCTIELDRRLIPGESWCRVFEDYDRLLDDVRARNPSVQIRMHPPMLIDLPLDCDPELQVIRQLVDVLVMLNLNGIPQGVPYGSDASKLAAVGIPSVILGPGNIDQAHSADEYVECRQVEKAVEVYSTMMQMKIG